MIFGNFAGSSIPKKFDWIIRTIPIGSSNPFQVKILGKNPSQGSSGSPRCQKFRALTRLSQNPSQERFPKYSQNIGNVAIPYFVPSILWGEEFFLEIQEKKTGILCGISRLRSRGQPGSQIFGKNQKFLIPKEPRF